MKLSKLTQHCLYIYIYIHSHSLSTYYENNYRYNYCFWLSLETKFLSLRKILLITASSHVRLHIAENCLIIIIASTNNGTM